jgi:hypothetical protein
VASYSFLKTAPIAEVISIFLVGYLSLSKALKIGKSKRFDFMGKSLNYAIENGEIKQDLTDFYKMIKD